MFFDKRTKIEELTNKPNAEKAIKMYAELTKRIKASDPELVVALRRTADGKYCNMKWGEVEKLSPQTLKGLEFIGDFCKIKGSSYISIIWLPLKKKFDKLRQKMEVVQNGD